MKREDGGLKEGLWPGPTKVVLTGAKAARDGLGK